MLFSLQCLLAVCEILAVLRGTIARSIFVHEDGELMQDEALTFAKHTVERKLELWGLALQPRGGPARSKEGNKPVTGNVALKGKQSAGAEKSEGPEKLPKPVQPAQKERKGTSEGLATYTLSSAARHELDSMKLHGKERKMAIKWQKKNIKNEIKTNPLLKGKVEKGQIQHVAHEGGNDPKEPLHITASFQTADEEPVLNNFNGKKLHHVYVGTSGLPRRVKGALEANNAAIRDQSKTYQASVGPKGTAGKSNGKGKGRERPGGVDSKNIKEEFSLSL